MVEITVKAGENAKIANSAFLRPHANEKTRLRMPFTGLQAFKPISPFPPLQKIRDLLS